MMAVGDGDRAGRGKPEKLAGHIHISSGGITLGHDPQPMLHAVVVANRDCRRPCRDGRQQRGRPPGGLAIQPDYRAHVGACRTQELVTILLGSRHRALVGEHSRSVRQRLQPQAREETALCPLDGRARQAVGLLVDIDGGAGVLVERAIRSPLGEGAGCPSIALVGRVARQLGGQVETHGIRVLGRRDDVIGRTDHQPHVADRFRLVAKGAECSDSGQR